MATLEVTPQPAKPTTLDLPTLLAFFIIYIVWGSTFFAIRVAVATVPPLFAAAVRFLPAGLILYAWGRLRGAPSPSHREWRNLALLGALMFFITYSALFWGEKSVPSGIASVLVSTLPIWTMLLEVFLFKQETFRWPLLPALALGFGGVVVLTLNSVSGHVQLLPAAVIILGEIGWALGAVLSRRLTLPEEKTISAGAEMFLGGLMLLAGSYAGRELQPLPHLSAQAAGAILYLIVAGSLIGFTAFVWLLQRMPATHVSSHAYVNPVVALILGSWLGGEILSTRTVVGSALVLSSIVLIFITRTRSTTARARTR
jgi:drug/metabolite transporter (DMT)-like permease